MTERVIEFGRDDNLTGILNSPAAAEIGPDTPTVLLLNSGMLPRVGPCRLYVRIARQLAALGIPSLRFDFSGIGDSPPRTDGKTFNEYSIDEVGDAIDHLSNVLPSRNFCLLGICSGADTAWYAAIADSRVRSLILFDGFAFRNPGFYWYHYRRRIFDLSVWKNFLRNPIEALAFLAGREVLDGRVDPVDVVFDRNWPTQRYFDTGMAKLVDGDVGQLFIFTEGATSYFNHHSQLVNSCPPVKKSSQISVIFYPETDHMISDTVTQLSVLETVTTWVRNSQ